jgi:putative signal transducing protein
MESHSSEPVRLTVVLNEIEADQVQSLLKFEGIESMQRPTDSGAGSIGGSGAMSGSREILVRPGDLERAEQIIGEQ